MHISSCRMPCGLLRRFGAGLIEYRAFDRHSHLAAMRALESSFHHEVHIVDDIQRGAS
jgi:hypothetical protein